MKKSLLLKVSERSKLDEDIATIKQVFQPTQPIFILRERFGNEDEVEYFITFNTEYNFRLNGVIRVHKKNTTIYSIDALNRLAISEVGKAGRDFVPNWSEYENCILLSSLEEGKVNIIPSSVFEVIK